MNGQNDLKNCPDEGGEGEGEEGEDSDWEEKRYA